MLEKNNLIGYGQIAAGGCLGYQSIVHGLPRAVGIRIEYHTTSKENAVLIKRCGNVLDPNCGGKNGMGSKVNLDFCVKKSANFVHITGVHKDIDIPALGKFQHSSFFRPYCTLYRRMQNCLYKIVGNADKDEVSKIFNANNKRKKQIWLLKKFFAVGKNKTNRFCVPGIDSYFNSEYIPDIHDIALKSTKKIKVYSNRYYATLAGVKKFGLTGVKENKNRVVFGIAVLAAGLYSSVKVIKNGMNNLNRK